MRLPRHVVAASIFILACGDAKEDPASTAPAKDSAAPSEDTAVYADLDFEGFAKGCYLVRSGDTWLVATASSYAFSADGTPARFFMQPSDLATYLFYDEGGAYLVAEDGPLTRETSLHSDMSLLDDSYVSGAEWRLETSETNGNRYQLRNLRNDQLLSASGLTSDGTEALPIAFEATKGCTDHPELSLDATGEVTKTTFDDGDLYGIVDTHSHIMSNFGFGGYLYHGTPFHPLGVEHALPDCEVDGGR